MKRLRAFGQFLSQQSQRQSAARNKSQLRVESLEPRDMLAADCPGGIDADVDPHTDAELHVLFDAGTPQSYVDQVHAAVGHDDHNHDAISRYQASTRWGTTATDGGGLSWGDGTTITWSIAPDGTAIGGFAGEAAAPSNFVSFMAGIYGSSAGDVEDQPWFSIVASAFDSWSDVTGINFVYEANDDGVSFSGSNRGISGVRGDIRIGGHRIDGNSGTLAYNFFPNNGDMVIDTADGFYNSTGGNSLRLRNVLAHEIGHGLGISHVEPVNGTKLMEPFVNTSFDGPQHDDILAGHRLYGDVNEFGSGNDSFNTATDLGTLTDTSATLGDHAADNYLSIDDNGDADYFSFTVGAGAVLDATLSPVGFVYQQGPQGGSSSSFNSAAQSDLRLDIYDSTFSLVAAANNTGIANSEALSNVELAAGGTYYVRVSGAHDAAQFYQLDIAASGGGDPGDPPPADFINFNDYTIDSYGGGHDFTGPVAVEQNGAALHLTGNRWKKIDINYTITPDTVLEFDFTSAAQGEIHGIGFDNDLSISSNRTFHVYGTQNWGIRNFDNYAQPGTQHYVIPVGQFYTGNFSYLFFTNDHDVSNPTGDSIFSNVRIYEDGGGTPAPVVPTAANDTFGVNEDSATSTFNVLANDDDGGGTLAIMNVSSGSAGGTINISGGQSVTYRPSANFFGTETFTYTIANETGQSTATVTVNVQPVNDLPTAANDAFTVEQNSQGNVFNVLANDSTSPDVGETLTIVNVGSGSAGGTISTNGQQIFYTPADGFSGTENFTYTVNDGTPGSNDVTNVTVTVEALTPSDILNFNDFSIDSYGGQDFNGSATILDGGTTLRLQGNTWKRIDLPYNITANTVIEFDFLSTSQGEIHGIGLDNNNIITSSLTFHVYGTQNWGNRTFDNYGGSAGSVVHYTIPVGQFYQGGTQYLFFVNDHDVSNPSAVSEFSNVRVYEANAAQAISLGGSSTRARSDVGFFSFDTNNTSTPRRSILPRNVQRSDTSAVVPQNTFVASQFDLQRYFQSRRTSHTTVETASSPMDSRTAQNANVAHDWTAAVDRFFAAFGRT